MSIISKSAAPAQGGIFKNFYRRKSRFLTDWQHGLSAGMMDELACRLIKGGYGPDTPAAVVYKATWPDEKVFECTVAALGETARQAGITRTAVVLVGDAVSHTSYLRSRLYDPEFTTGYRQGTGEQT